MSCKQSQNISSSKLSSMSSYQSSSSKPRTSSLPLDLLRDILSRLPTISLLKLRSVCREWRDVIDDPHFAAMHTTTGIESPRILLLLGPSRSTEHWFAVDNEFLVTSLPKSAARSWLYGARASCHGLLCFDDLCQGLTYLLNPLTREIISLTSVEPWRVQWRPHRIGIGVDCLTRRYKIVRLSCSIDCAARPIKAEVLDQGSRSWRDIASVPPSHLLGGPVFAAGSIHWEAAGGGGLVRISSFDITKEEFAWTPCPELRDAHLVDLRGVLGLVDSSHQERLDVWAMKESGRWVKQYNVRLNSPCPVSGHWFLTVLGCGGRKIVFKYLESLLCYNPATDELEYVQRAGDAPDRRACSITISLLSPAKLWNANKVLPWVA
ncbi:putative F-box protein At1g32420 [Rhodamnia argentea]|uniref:F-box protein At1g32420 n=1 Tax=Rhodamnia argentea TaxID=178133 RepID=A0A8B8NJD4_9MYRT|nr:putative F-box protein At1g32420 [Rhodamnia argentea]